MLFRGLTTSDNNVSMVKSVVPTVSREGNRFNLMYGFLFDFLTNTAGSYELNRLDWIFYANTTGQVFVLENALNKKFDNVLKRIYITEVTETFGYPVALNEIEDSTKYLSVSNLAGGTGVELVSVYTNQVDNYDFTVVIPVGVDDAAVAEMVEHYRIAGSTYNIIYE